VKFPKDQPFWTSIILHVVVLVALFLATIIETLRPKEKPHVFEIVTPPSERNTAAAPTPTPPSPDVPSFELPAVPELADIPDVPQPVAQVPPPRPQPAPQRPAPQPAPQKPKLISQEEFIRQHGAPQARQPSQPAPRRPVNVPTIETPRLVVPTNPTPNAANPAPLTAQQRSALDAYNARLRARIDAAWAKPASLAGVRIAATVIFDVSASGTITNARLRPASGNAAFDQSVLAAFRKVISAGPTPTGQGHSFSMTFRMSD